MRFTKQTFITGFALFSLFFGAGNLILPSFLGYNAGDSWIIVLLGFVFSAVVIPILAIYGHARIQGTMMDFATKVSPIFALIYCLIVYTISVTLPSPRTASVTYEMAIQPYFDISSIWLSTAYFILVFIIAINRSKVMDWVGKFLTPGILLILALVIVRGMFFDYEPMRTSIFKTPLTAGLLEGYQTFDAIGGVVVGAVVVVSLGLKGGSYLEKQKTIIGGGVLAGLGLLIIYGGMLYLGALQSGELQNIDRTSLLTQLSTQALGSIGTNLLAILVSLACFTTAVGIVTGTSDFMMSILGGTRVTYIVTAFVASILGIIMGQMDVHTIIAIAIPALMFIYPITIILILLNVLPKKLAPPIVFKLVVLVTIISSVPDFLGSLGFETILSDIRIYIPMVEQGLMWVVPAFITFILTHILLYFKFLKT